MPCAQTRMVTAACGLPAADPATPIAAANRMVPTAAHRNRARGAPARRAASATK